MIGLRFKITGLKIRKENTKEKAEIKIDMKYIVTTKIEHGIYIYIYSMVCIYIYSLKYIGLYPLKYLQFSIYH